MKSKCCLIWTLSIAIPLSTLLVANNKPEQLFGDFGGIRPDLENRGLKVKAKHVLDCYDDISGAPKTGTLYFGRFQIDATVDLEKVLKWENSKLTLGAIHQYGHHSYNRNVFSVLTNPSTIESRQLTRLTNFFFSQSLMDGHLNYKIGKLAGAAEFGFQEYSSSFMNLELNYLPRIIIQPSTGTNLAFHPGQKWGFVTKYQINKDPNDTKYIKFGLFDTNNYKVYEDDENGLSFDYTGPLAYALELGIHKPGPATSFAKVGAHWNEGSFPDLSSVSAGAKINNNYLFYFSLGRTLAQFGARDKTHLDGSIMWSYAPADRNLYNQQLTCALRLVGPFASRPKDEIGLGSIMSFLSNDYAKKNNLAMNEEYTVELSYKAKISPFFTIQPGIQAVFNPKGNNNRSDLYLATVRTVITF